MDLNYKKLLAEYEINENELSGDAVLAIRRIKKSELGISLIEKKGVKVRRDTLEDIRLLDKWVCGEIIDYINDKNDNADEAPIDPKKLEKEVDEQVSLVTKKKTQDNEIGKVVEKELENLKNKGVSSISIDELKSSAKESYSIVFDTYQQGEINGIKTNKYSLIEKKDDPKVFTITKN